MADPGFPGDGGKNLLLGKIFAKNFMKIKEIGPRGDEARHVPSAPHPDPPITRNGFF